MRLIHALLAALTLGTVTARAQWEIFAESPPPDGSWATYRVTRKKGEEKPSVSEIRITARDGTVVKGTPCVWLQISPVKWLGSRNRGQLGFLIPRAMDAEKAGRLLFVAKEILFADPGKGPWYMTPDDVAWLADKVDLTSVCRSTPAGEGTAADAAGKPHACAIRELSSRLSIDPPFASEQVTLIEGRVWRSEATPFAVVRAEWKETLRKGDESTVETKTLELLDSGRDTAPPPPIVHGEPFSLWRLLRR